ncbi:MAG: glycosyltransferase family 39 protein [Cyanobacteria bacterium J06626_6]
MSPFISDTRPQPLSKPPERVYPETRPQIWQDILCLLGWAGLLILSSQIYPSLMAHDEGNYALESRFMLTSGEWLARQSWGELTYSHGILLNWLIMICYQLFGTGAAVSAEWAVRIARLPTMLACMGAVLLTYDIGKMLFAQQVWGYAKYARRLGLLSAMLLMVISVWTQYSHLATQDMLLVSTELLGVWSLLKAESCQHLHPKYGRIGFGFLAGLTFGVGYLIKTFMIVLPAIALLPYLIFEHRRHRHLTNPGLYAGLAAGLGAVILWVGLSVATYGTWVLDSMFGKLTELSAESFHPDGGPFYYLWNIPANMVPWVLFAAVGTGLVVSQPKFWKGIFSLQKPSAKKAYQGDGLEVYQESDQQARRQPYPHRWLLLYPFLMVGMLTMFTTKTAYYTLQLHPFLAFFSAIALHHVAIQRSCWPRRLLSFSFAAIGLVLFALAVLIILGTTLLETPPALFTAARPYTLLALLLGGGWMLLPIFLKRPQQWIAAWLIPAWLTLGATGLLGFFGNYSADVAAALTTPPVAPIVQAETIDFVTGPEWPADLHKSMILIAFHTPYLGQLNRSLEALSPGSYAWLSDNADLQNAPPFETIAQVRQWRLVRL